jgi:hypothetical protein
VTPFIVTKDPGNEWIGGSEGLNAILGRNGEKIPTPLPIIGLHLKTFFLNIYRGNGIGFCSRAPLKAAN